MTSQCYYDTSVTMPNISYRQGNSFVAAVFEETDMCASMRTDIGTDMCTDMCTDVCMHASAVL